MKRIVVMLMLALTGCSTGTEGTTEVDWQNHDPSVKVRIEQMAASGDCAGLQAEFDTAEANGDAQRARTGEGNAERMGYIDEKMAGPGCYD